MNETPHAPVVEQVLVAAAFGNQPGSWPLPTAITPHHLWLRAVAAGGQGRYAHAYGDLSVLRRLVPAGPLASLAHSTQGSLLRQLGWHTLARGWDGRALALAGADREAGADALIGLAADALGVGRFAAAGALLDRADPLVVSPLVADRLAVRRRWVAAELAMATGDGATAVRHAEEAVELTQAMAVASARHRVKSDVVLAAALCSAGAVARARAVGEEALDATARFGLLPLRWALACLLIDIGTVTFSAQQLRELTKIRNICAGQVRRAGGCWRIDPGVSPGCVRFVTLEISPSMTMQGERLDAVVAEAVAGDRNALREVLETIRPIVVRYCRARVGTVERSGLSADDVAQEVCLATITALPRYRDRGRPFLAFLYGIAAHKVADAHRAAGRDRAYPAETLPERWSADAGPEQMAIEADSVTRMNELLEILPAKQREILILRVVVGLSAEETAAAVGSTTGAVRVAQHRALQRLKDEIVAAGDYA